MSAPNHWVECHETSPRGPPWRPPKLVTSYWLWPNSQDNHLSASIIHFEQPHTQTTQWNPAKPYPRDPWYSLANWLGFGDLDIIFKVIGTFQHFTGLGPGTGVMSTPIMWQNLTKSYHRDGWDVLYTWLDFAFLSYNSQGHVALTFSKLL